MTEVTIGASSNKSSATPSEESNPDPLGAKFDELKDKYLTLRSALVDYLRGDQAKGAELLSHVLDLDMLLVGLSVTNPQCPSLLNDADHHSQPAHAVSALRSLMAQFDAGTSPRPLSDRFLDRLRPALDEEILGIQMASLRAALFTNRPDYTDLLQAVSNGWLDIPVADTPAQGFAFHVVTRGTKVGIFDDVTLADRYVKKVPFASRKGAKSYFDALLIFVKAWLSGEVGIFYIPE